MKKILIPAFFVGMILLTYVVAVAMTSARMDDTNVSFRTAEYELSDSEVAAVNYTRSEANKFPTEKTDIIKCYDLKETRTKKFFGWDLKVDTLKDYYKIRTHN